MKYACAPPASGAAILVAALAGIISLPSCAPQSHEKDCTDGIALMCESERPIDSKAPLVAHLRVINRSGAPIHIAKVQYRLRSSRFLVTQECVVATGIHSEDLDRPVKVEGPAHSTIAVSLSARSYSNSDLICEYALSEIQLFLLGGAAPLSFENARCVLRVIVSGQLHDWDPIMSIRMACESGSVADLAVALLCCRGEERFVARANVVMAAFLDKPTGGLLEWIICILEWMNDRGLPTDKRRLIEWLRDHSVSVGVKATHVRKRHG